MTQAERDEEYLNLTKEQELLSINIRARNLKQKITNLITDCKQEVFCYRKLFNYCKEIFSSVDITEEQKDVIIHM